MGLYILKFGFREVLKPLLKIFRNVNPDIVSYLAVPAALFTGGVFYFTYLNCYLFLIAVFLIFLRMVFNTLDGMIALQQKKTSPQGEIVNALPDRYSDIFTLLGMVFCPRADLYLGILALVSMLLVSYTGMLGKAVGVSWQHHGPLGKVERLISIMVFSLAQFILDKFRIGLNLWGWLFLWFILAGQVTVYNRIKGLLRQIGEKHAE